MSQWMNSTDSPTKGVSQSEFRIRVRVLCVGRDWSARYEVAGLGKFTRERNKQEAARKASIPFQKLLKAKQQRADIAISAPLRQALE